MNKELICIERKLLRKREVAELVTCSSRTIERLVQDGKLTPVKIRGAVRFLASQVEELINPRTAS